MANDSFVGEGLNPTPYREMKEENERLRGALKQFAECDLNDRNCSGLPVAVARIRNIARAALAGEKPC